MVPIDLDADFEVGIISKEDKQIEAKNNRIKYENKKNRKQTDIVSQNIFNFLSIEDSIDQFLIQNAIDIEEDQMILENINETNENNLERTIHESSFRDNLNIQSKRKSLSRSSSPVRRKNKNDKDIKEGEELL